MHYSKGEAMIYAGFKYAGTKDGTGYGDISGTVNGSAREYYGTTPDDSVQYGGNAQGWGERSGTGSGAENWIVRLNGHNRLQK
jgi:hypothetical protein